MGERRCRTRRDTRDKRGYDEIWDYAQVFRREELQPSVLRATADLAAVAVGADDALLLELGQVLAFKSEVVAEDFGCVFSQ